MLESGDRVIVGFSGGADSVLLLTLLVQLKEQYELDIIATHINHGMRGLESDADEAFAKAYSEKIGVDFLSFHEHVPTSAKELGMGLEEAGREIRYRCFQKALESRKANKIAVAHNKNDNAETVFMRICRGTGSAGLCGIPPVRGSIIRPLIETGRVQIERYLSDQQIPYRTDTTNHSNEFTRNHIRNKIIPNIESDLGIDLCEKLDSLSRLCSIDEDFMDKIARDSLSASLLTSQEPNVILSIPALRTNHPAITARIIRLALSESGLKIISACHIEAANSLINNKTGKQIRLPDGLFVGKYYDELHFTYGDPKDHQSFHYDLKPDTSVHVPELSKCFLLSENPAPINSGLVCTKAFLYDKIVDVQIRSRLPGDRICIRHIGTVKLKEYFINNKIPSYQRSKIGLVAQGNDVLWILDNKNICHEQYESLEGESKKVFIHELEVIE